MALHVVVRRHRPPARNEERGTAAPFERRV